MATLAHFTLPAKVEWIADVAGLPQIEAETALEDLSDRALIAGDVQAQTYLLPPLTATFLRRKRPDVIMRAGNRLLDRGYALVLENGYQNYDGFKILDAEWPALAAALPLFAQGDNARLQTLCDALQDFLRFTGHWDDQLSLSLQAEVKALAAKDWLSAGWRAYDAGVTYNLRKQPAEVLACATRAEAHWGAG